MCLCLQGAPFGFTPFCDNNKDMEGFRFWKQGFWKEHLRGKPYHISALFVVDLARFRSDLLSAQMSLAVPQAVLCVAEYPVARVGGGHNLQPQPHPLPMQTVLTSHC